MNSLPLIHRELLVNARKPSTRRLRVAVAVAALLVATLFLIAMEKSTVFGRGFPGLTLFQILIWMGLATTGLFGVFFAADTISEERREGTLGLLFLTPLRGYDVVLGKLTGTSLRSAYALLAALPIIALPLLLGGVTFTNYFRVALVLGNSLFLSTAAGLMVSALSRDSVRAIMGTLALILVLTGLPLWIDASMTDGTAGFKARVSHVSPGYALYIAASGNGTNLWLCLASQHALAWLALAVAAFRTTRLGESVPKAAKSKAARFFASAPRRQAQTKLRGREPITWLVQRRSRGPTIIALIVLILAAISMALQSASDAPVGAVFAPTVSFLGGLFYFLVLVWLTVQATRRTGDARRTGELELMLATPVTVREIVRGHWNGMVRIFLVSIMVVVALKIVGSIFQLIQLQQIYTNMPAGSTSPPQWSYVPQYVVSAAFSVIGVFTTTAAVAWVGLWFGLTGENNAVSAAKVFVMVVVAPAVVLAVVQMFGLLASVIVSGGRSDLMWLSAAIHGTVSLAIDVAFIVVARRSLLKHFREAATGTVVRRKFSIRKQFSPATTPAAG